MKEIQKDLIPVILLHNFLLLVFLVYLLQFVEDNFFQTFPLCLAIISKVTVAEDG